MDFEPPNFDQDDLDETPVSDPYIGQSLSPGVSAGDRRVPDTRVYHSKINGTSCLFNTLCIRQFIVKCLL